MKINACPTVAEYILLFSHELCTVGQVQKNRLDGGFRNLLLMRLVDYLLLLFFLIIIIILYSK